MKPGGMPTISNDTPVESYSDYKERKVRSLVKSTEEILVEIFNSSLTDKDKKDLRYELIKMFIL